MGEEGETPRERGADGSAGAPDVGADGSGDGTRGSTPDAAEAGGPAADAGGRGPTRAEGGPTDREVVAAASEAAEGVVFSRYRRSDVRDVDVAVSYEDGLLEVDVYLNVPDADDDERVDEEAGAVADDAALAAIDAVDRLFGEGGRGHDRAGDLPG